MRPRLTLPTALLAALVASCPSAAGAASSAPVAILGYHHIGSPPPGAAHPELWVSERLLRRQLTALDRAGYRAVTLQRLWRAWHGAGRLPARPIVLTFDDGYRSQAQLAAPALRAHRWPGVLNLQVGRLGTAGGLTRAQVRSVLAAGFLAALTTHAGLVDATTDPFALGRVLVPSGRSPSALLQAVRTGG